mgnify:CR=1 FL=1
MDTGNRIYITMEDTLKYLNSNIDDIINNEKEPVRTYRLESMRDNFKNSVVSFEFTTIIDRLNNISKESLSC